MAGGDVITLMSVKSNPVMFFATCYSDIRDNKIIDVISPRFHPIFIKFVSANFSKAMRPTSLNPADHGLQVDGILV
jgi:hypothetical protein